MKLDKETNTLTLEDGSVYKVELIKKSFKRWKPKDGEKYYSPNTGLANQIASAKWSCDGDSDGDNYDNSLYSLGEVFQAEEEARKEYNYRVTRQRVKDAIAELNDSVVDSTGYFEFSRIMTCYESSLLKCYGEDWKLLRSSASANKLREMFTDAELKLALFEIHE